MKIQNTLTRKKEEFKPIRGNKVNLFVCGPTVYDYPHLGHAKTNVQFDFIAKYLRYRGYEVFFLQNITDLDDKIIDRARVAGISWKELSEKFTQIYKENMLQLHVDSINEYASATDFIPQIISQVQRLLDKGFAYKISDGIYFELSKFKDYGKLSGRTELEEEDAVSRIDDSSEKRGWGDFCLWKFSKQDEPIWDAPFGNGRPGWHIEDTAITEHFFGPQYDIHGGGSDLMFPHHEAEITQMESISGKSPLVNYWLHTGFLNIDDKKMSKSKGNFLTIEDVLDEYPYEVLRFFFVSNHYRSQLNFSRDSLEQAKSSVKRINDFISSLDADDSPVGEDKLLEVLKEKIIGHLDDDFDTPTAFARMFEYIKERNIDKKAGKLTLEFFRKLNEVYDFMSFDNEVSLDEEILGLIDQREKSRKAGDYAEADRIRDSLKEKNIELYDTPDGVKWRRM